MEKLLFLPKHRNNKAQLLSEMTIFFLFSVREILHWQYLPGCAIKMEQEIGNQSDQEK